MTGPPATTTRGEVMVLDATRSRQETEIVMRDASQPEKSHPSKSVMIVDWGRRKGLTLAPAAKKAGRRS